MRCTGKGKPLKRSDALIGIYLVNQTSIKALPTSFKLEIHLSTQPHSWYTEIVLRSAVNLKSHT